MKYTFFSLTDLINDSEIGKKQIKSILSDFSCPANPEVEIFLKELAYGYEKAGKTKTFLIYAEEQSEQEANSKPASAGFLLQTAAYF